MRAPQELLERKKMPDVTYSKTVNKVIALVYEETLELGSNFISPEHILLGLLRDEVTQQVFTTLDMDQEKIRLDLETLIKLGGNLPKRGIELNPRARKIVELAEVEAISKANQKVIPNDLLIGIVRLGEGAAAIMLEKHGLGQNRLPMLEGVSRSLRSTYDLLQSPQIDRERKNYVVDAIVKSCVLHERGLDSNLPLL